MKVSPLITALVFLGLCAEVQAGPIRDLLKGKADKSVSSSFKKLSDIAYGGDKKQKMDIYLPNGQKNAPIMVMVHGGAWSLGDKGSTKVVANKLKRWVNKGAIFISVNYRLLPEADPLKQAEDVASAMIYIQLHAKEWGGNPEKIVLMGHSSGAHLVSLVSADISRYDGLKPWLGSVSLDSAAMDVTKVMGAKHYPFYNEAFGYERSYWEEASPYHRLNKSSLPLLMVCSSVRPDEPCEDAKLMQERAKEMSVIAKILPEPLRHGEINDELGLDNEYTRKVEEFIRSLGTWL